MFPDGYRNEVHIVGTVMGADMENPYDVLALNAAANQLIQAGLDTFGPGSPRGFQLQVLRDILNDS